MGQCEEHLDTYCWHRKVILGHVRLLTDFIHVWWLCYCVLQVWSLTPLENSETNKSKSRKTWRYSRVQCLYFAHIYHATLTTVFLCRRNASYVALEVTTLIQRRMALRLTLLMNTTWPITCECPSSVLPWTLTKVLFFYLFTKTYLSYIMGADIMCRLSAFTWEYQHLNLVKGLWVSAV